MAVKSAFPFSIDEISNIGGKSTPFTMHLSRSHYISSICHIQEMEHCNVKHGGGSVGIGGLGIKFFLQINDSSRFVFTEQNVIFNELLLQAFDFRTV